MVPRGIRCARGGMPLDAMAHHEACLQYSVNDDFGSIEANSKSLLVGHSEQDDLRSSPFWIFSVQNGQSRRVSQKEVPPTERFLDSGDLCAFMSLITGRHLSWILPEDRQKTLSALKKWPPGFSSKRNAQNFSCLSVSEFEKF
jgi:hypothetical protein